MLYSYDCDSDTHAVSTGDGHNVLYSMTVTLIHLLCLQEMAVLRVQLEKVHVDERQKEEVELKAAQQRKAAIEDLEKGVCCLYCFKPDLMWSVLPWSILKWSILKWSILKHAMRQVCVVCVATYLSVTSE